VLEVGGAVPGGVNGQAEASRFGVGVAMVVQGGSVDGSYQGCWL
jgi:ribosomal protein S9